MAILDNLRIFTMLIFEVLTNIRYWEITCAILKKLHLFVLKVFYVLANTFHGCLRWICLLASYCLTVPCNLIKPISVAVTKLRDIMAAILDNLRIFAAMILEVLTNIRYWDVSCAIFNNLCWFIFKISNALTSITQLFVEWIYWLTSYCLTVPCYVIKSVSTVVAKLWEIMVTHLENLRLFTLKISDALTCITHRSMEWIYMLALYCLSVPRNLVNSILIILANLWEILVAILDNLRLNILKISYGVTSITNRLLKWIYLRATYCLAVPCYVVISTSIVVAKLWEMLAAILDNLRLFILKIPDALTIITDLLLKWINLLASHCVTVLCFVLKPISIVVTKLWEMMVALLDNLPLFILKISDALTSLTHLFMEWIYFLASNCLTVPYYVLKSISTVVAQLWKIMEALLDNLRLFILKIPDALTIITDLLLKWINLLASHCVTVLCFVLKPISIVVTKLWEMMVALLDNLPLFILKISDALTSLTHLFMEWIYFLASNCLTVPYYVLKSISTVVAQLWEIMVTILDNLHLFIMKIPDALTIITDLLLKWIYLLALYCLTVPCYVLKSISIVVTKLWEIMVALLDNLPLFILKISDALTSIIHRSLEYIYLLASYCLTVPCYVLTSISVFVAKLWEIIVAILDSLCLFVLKISNTLTSIKHHFLEWIYLLASCCLTVPSYVLESISVFVTKLWEMMVALLDNLHLFILKISDTLTSIIYHLLEWIYWLSLYCLTSPCYVVKSISVVVAKLWEIMMAILDNLRMFILKISNALTSITHHFLEWINLLASYCVSVPRSVLKSISVVVARLCVITITNLDNLRLYLMKVPDALTRITRRFSEWIIGRVYDNYHLETNEGDHPREGMILTARFY